MSRTFLCVSLLHDEAGFIISSELVLVATIVVIGMVAGLTCVRNAVVSELTDVGQAFNALNQSYCYTGFSARKSFCCGIKSRTAGSQFVDVTDGGETYVDFGECLLEPIVDHREIMPAPCPLPIPVPLPPAPVPAPIIECPPTSIPVPAPALDSIPGVPPCCPAPANDCAIAPPTPNCNPSMFSTPLVCPPASQPAVPVW